MELLVSRLALDNPWWQGNADPDAALPRRALFERFFSRVNGGGGLLRLGGPRRVGKSVLVRQTVARLLDTGTPAQGVAVIPWDAPALSNQPLSHLLDAMPEGGAGLRVLFLDGLQHRPGGAAEAAALAAARPDLAIVTASAMGGPAAADVVLPPLGFAEYLQLTGDEAHLIEPVFLGRNGRPGMYAVRDMAGLNRRFVHYLNGGGFPEAVLLRHGGDGGRILRDGVLGAVLHQDLPALSGIAGTAELTALFTRLARDTGREMTLEGLAEDSGLAKNTVRRHLEYLESAFLIIRMGRVHPEGGRFRRMRSFKLHLTAPCLRAALYGPTAATVPAFAALAEGGIVGQWLASPERERLVFCRLPEGTVDLVGLSVDDGRPVWACALPGTDESLGLPTSINGLIQFSRRNSGLRWLGATTRTLAALKTHEGVEVWHRPAAQYCYEVGRRTIDGG